MSRALRRWLVGAASLMIAAVTAAAVFLPPARSTERHHHGVLIQDFVYDPALVAVRVGDVVTWANQDIVPHTVTAEDGSWDSGQIGPGESWSMIVSEEFGAAHFCVYHPGMRSRLAIGPGS